MTMKTNYLVNLELDYELRGQAFTPPATYYVALMMISGIWIASTAYAVGDYVVPTTSNGRLYKCTTAGATGASEPTWSTTDAGTVTDGTVVWTEQTTDMQAGTFPTEATGGSYARASLTPSLTSMAGTQGAGTTAVSSGTSGTTSNNAAISFPSPTASWGTGQAGVEVWYDAATAGTAYFFGVLTNPQTPNVGGTVESAIGASSFNFGA